MERQEKNFCVECGRETQAFYSPSIGWYCGDCKRMWEEKRKLNKGGEHNGM